MKRTPLLNTSALWLAAGLLAVGAAGCSKAPNGQTAAAVSEPASGVGAQSDDGPAVTASQSDAGYSASSGGATPASYEVPTPPPALPTYDQPPPPGPGYLWTPGYWGWSDSAQDYYWTPGTWALPPAPDDYWTPGYWNYLNGGYAFIPGYWGLQVGFYGGVNYGWGYGGDGYVGGQWRNNQFYYNSDANNLGGGHFANVYANRVSNREGGGAGYNGGPHGLRARPTSRQEAFARGAHTAPTSAQMQHFQMARQDPGQRADVNHGRPAVVATARPAAFRGAGAVTQVRTAPNYTRPTMPARAGAAAMRPAARTPERAPPIARTGEPARPMTPAREARPAEHAPVTRAPAARAPAARAVRAAPERAAARPAPRAEMASRPAPVENRAPAARPAMAAPRAAPHPAASHAAPARHDQPHP